MCVVGVSASTPAMVTMVESSTMYGIVQVVIVLQGEMMGTITITYHAL